MTTLREMIDKVLTRASLEAGIDTQVYSDVPVTQIIQSTFDTLFDMFWWPQFYTAADPLYKLDGTSGRVTGDLSVQIKRFVDLRYVWYNGMPNPLPRAPLRANPMTIQNPCVSPTSDPTKVFQMFPLNSTGSIILAYRTKPNDFVNEDDIIDFDDEMLVLGAAYDYVNSIGLNPGAEDKLQQKFQNRIAMMMGELQNMDVAFGDGQVPPPTSWNWY